VSQVGLIDEKTEVRHETVPLKFKYGTGMNLLRAIIEYNNFYKFLNGSFHIATNQSSGQIWLKTVQTFVFF
jgi:hypothetical protein